MSSTLVSLAAFLVAIGILVTVHEFGHFWVARRLGVKVLRFSIGFGKPLWRRNFGKDNTELVVAILPLGGYVRMLDEREGEVAEHELPRAFNRKPVATRVAVVTAGPLFNFLFAILAYWIMYSAGVPGLKPVTGEVVPGSLAEQAGFVVGDELLAIDGEPTPSWEHVVMALLDAGLEERQSVSFSVRSADGQQREIEGVLGSDSGLLAKGGILENYGLGPWQIPAVIGELMPDEPALRAGLRPGDELLAADGKSLAGWAALVDYVRGRPGRMIDFQVRRDGRQLNVAVRAGSRTEGDTETGYIGAAVRLPDEQQRATMRVVTRYGPLDAVSAALDKTGDVVLLTLRTLWKMVTGKASVENLSGPISIAQYAGQSASIGLATFLGFLGIVSISLGVLNLLPVPVLDGGHLLFYLAEIVKGSPVSEKAQLVGQKIGIVLLVALMTLAFYNDIVRLLE